jgi:type IV secretory pathway ATPase VirB11/archaellum biosynthesis ATPase
MMIGGFKVGNCNAREEAGKKHLLFDCRECVYGTSIADDSACRFHVLSMLSEIDADLVVLAEVYERVYEEPQTEMLKEMVKLKQKFEIENAWSYSNLGETEGKADERFIPTRHKMAVTIAHDLLAYDPIKAYFSCLSELGQERIRFKEGDSVYKKGSQVYLNTLEYLKENFEKTALVGKVKKFVSDLHEVPETNEIYRVIFEAQIKPSFIGSRLMFKDEEGMELQDEYTVKNSTVQVFSQPNKTMSLYFVNPPEYSLSPEKYFILSKTKEIVAGYKPGRASLSTVAKSREYFERIYQTTIMDIAAQNNITLTKNEVQEMSAIVARYSVGYGILEVLLSDRKITDIYVDSPIGENPLYIVHSDFGQCTTNILFTEREAMALVTKMRAMSGRPFDEAHPVLDYDLPDLETRVATIGPPLAPDGVAFAFRLHKTTPWTLPQFIDAKFMSPLAAGLLSFFIDNQTTMIITGSRGSGKTSLMGSLILEIPKNTRIIVQEDTLETPAPYLKRIGFNIQRLKTRSPIGASGTESEVSPEEALRTALRLGDSALVIGEVRSTEAKTLYEAMRIGAAGNVVLGTIHGDSAYSVWDRVVNDLNVPNTSFKATDIVVVSRPIRFGGSMRRFRRLVQITEIKKHWISEPQQEGGLLDLMLYDAASDNIDLIEDNLKESDIFNKISKLSGLSIEELWEDIKLRGDSKAFLVELKKKHSLPDLLEAKNTSLAHDKLLLLKEKQLGKKTRVNYKQIFEEWKEWVESYLVKRVAK